MKVPAIIASSLICLVVGLGIGSLGMMYIGPIKLPTWLGGPPEPVVAGDQQPPPGGPPWMLFGKGDKGDKKGGPNVPNAKTQLSNLVAKLDVLTNKPLTVVLDADEKKQVREQLKGVEAMELTEDDARQRLDALLAALKEHKEALVLAGFAWPGEGIGAMREMAVPPNPFMLTANGKHLQSLRERLGPPNP